MTFSLLKVQANLSKSVLLASQMATEAARMVYSTTVHNQFIPMGIDLWMHSQPGWWCWACVAIVQEESDP